MPMGLIKTSGNRQILLNGDDACRGEIRLEVKLANAADEALAADGKLAAESIRSVIINAIVDTGAVRSVIPRRVCEQLGLGTVERDEVRYADGRLETVDVAGPIEFRVLDRRTFDDAYVLGEEVLIGQTILEKLDLWADCKNCRLVPNPAHPDGPRHRV